MEAGGQSCKPRPGPRVLFAPTIHEPTSGFILAGVGYGYLSEGETVTEPALAAILVSVVAYFIIRSLEFSAFENLMADGTFTCSMVITFLNGLILTFGGA